MNERTVIHNEPQTAPEAARSAAVHLSREQARKIKAMGRSELEAYLMRVWRRGYDAGLRAPAMGGRK